MRTRFPDQSRERITALVLIDCLNSRYDFHLTSGGYSDIERGTTLPRDLEKFMDAIKDVLKLSEDEYRVLIQTAAYEIVSRRLGPAVAANYIKIPHYAYSPTYQEGFVEVDEEADRALADDQSGRAGHADRADPAH